MGIVLIRVVDEGKCHLFVRIVLSTVFKTTTCDISGIFSQIVLGMFGFIALLRVVDDNKCSRENHLSIRIVLYTLVVIC